MSPLPALSGSWRGPLAWTISILGTLAVAVAIGVRIGVPASGGSLLQSTYEIRAALAFVALGLAFVLRREGSRPERVGLVALAAALLLTTAIDWAVRRYATAAAEPGGILGMSVHGFGLLGRAVRALVGVLLPAFVAGRTLGIGEGLLRVPNPAARPLAVAVLAGIFLTPSLAAAKKYGGAFERMVHLAVEPGSASPASWPTVADAFQGLPYALLEQGALGSLLVTLCLSLPAVELLLHGVLRASFGRWGLLPFVVGTAFCAAILCVDTTVNYSVFVGALATGLLAARSGSVIPGFVFWQAVYVGAILWSPLVQG